MNLSLSEYFCVVFLNLAREHETIELPAVKTEIVCVVFTLGIGPKLAMEPLLEIVGGCITSKESWHSPLAAGASWADYEKLGDISMTRFKAPNSQKLTKCLMEKEGAPHCRRYCQMSPDP